MNEYQCDECGSYLDPGEKCDCHKMTDAARERATARKIKKPTRGTAAPRPKKKRSYFIQYKFVYTPRRGR